MGAPKYYSIQELPVYAIVIRDDPRSEFYFEKITPVWKQLQINLQRFDAHTPGTMPDTLTFHRNEANKYKHLPSQSKEFTETEKACWYSHYALWKRCIELDRPIVVIEHDTVPFNPDLLFYSNKEWFRSYDKGAMGCYMIKPLMADFICRITEKDGVYSGPMGHIEYWYGQFAGGGSLQYGERFVGPITNGYTPACTQIMRKDVGSTVDHYGGTVAEDDPMIQNKKPFPFLMLDDLPDTLTIESIQAMQDKYDYIADSLRKKRPRRA